MNKTSYSELVQARELSYAEMVRAAREDKEYLSYIDLPEGSRCTVTIEKLLRKTNVTSAGGRKTKVVDFLKFEGKDKLLWLSLGKLKALKSILGPEAKNWVGKEIVLYADPTVKMSGVAVGGIVIEAKKEAASNARS